LGRALDDIHGYGVEALFSEIAIKVCEKEGIKRDFSHIDTTTFSVTGEYLPDSDGMQFILRMDIQKTTVRI